MRTVPQEGQIFFVVICPQAWHFSLITFLQLGQFKSCSFSFVPHFGQFMVSPIKAAIKTDFSKVIIAANPARGLIFSRYFISGWGY